MILIRGDYTGQRRFNQPFVMHHIILSDMPAHGKTQERARYKPPTNILFGFSSEIIWFLMPALTMLLPLIFC